MRYTVEGRGQTRHCNSVAELVHVAKELFHKVYQQELLIERTVTLGEELFVLLTVLTHMNYKVTVKRDSEGTV